ncbi:globin [Dyella koreensis]|uniref:Globin n=1 Tax=Dyella koreensis TaxID=311235 RepID=A0ABW8K547_9GAMM
MNDNYDDLQVSFGRCLRQRGFIERFYEILLASHPAIPPMFARTDFRGQRLALRRGISMAISWASGSTMVQRPMQQMIDVHSRAGRAPVEPALYVCWIESLLQAIAEFDTAITPALAARWRAAMQKVVDAFARNY